MTVVSAAINTTSEERFLQDLQQGYAADGIGAGLDFAQVLAYWRHEAPLPVAWRQALAERIRLVADSDLDTYSHRNRSEELHRWADEDVTPEQLIESGERLVVLLMPLFDVRELHYWLLSTFTYGPKGLVQHTQDRRWLAAQFQSLQGWADAIAEGQGEWAPVHNWYIQAGARPQVLSGALRSIDNRYAQDRLLLPFLQLHSLLLLVREQLQRDEVPTLSWGELLLRFADVIINSDWRSLDSKLYAELQRQIAVPLLRALLDSELFARLLSESQDYKSTFNRLFKDVGLAYVLAEQSGRMRAIAEQLPDSSLQGLQPPYDVFGSECAAAALELEQVFYARFGVVKASLDSPEALQWYRQLMASTPKKSTTFASSFSQLVAHVSDTELDELIDAHYFNDAESEFPCWLWTRNNRESLVRYLGAKCDHLPRAAVRRLWELTGIRQPGYDFRYAGPGQLKIDPQGWATVMAACARYPGLFIEHSISAEDLLRGGDQLERWQMLWELTTTAGQRSCILRQACRGLVYPSLRTELLPYLSDWYVQEPKLLEEYLSAPYCSSEVDALLGCPKRMWPLLIALAAYSLEASPSARRGIIQRFQRLKTADAIAANPQVYAALDARKQVLLLPLFNSAGVLACAATLGKVLAASNKTMRDPAVKLIASCTAEIIQRSGLLPGPAKARANLLSGIAQSRDPLMAPLIAEYFHDAAHDDLTRGLSLDALERAGYPVVDLDPWASLDLVGLQREAQLHPGELPEGIWTEAFSTQLQALGERLGRLLLALMLKAERLPRRARQILAFLSAAQRSEFALLAVNRWIEENGANEYLWLLQPMREYADDRVADALAKAVQEWKKTRTQKSALAIALLCELPGKYGCFQARHLWENGKLGNSIKASASIALTAAAELRGLSLEEFLEVLAPDFGMGPQGLVLDVGPYSYTVRVRADLSLAVFDAAGKVCKSLPKARAEEDPDKRALAENQFKSLSKNLKPVLKQQAQRLLQALQLGHSWPAATWQRLFMEHPLLNLIAQHVVWSVTGADEQPLQRVRPDNSGGLVDLNDQAYALPEGSTLHVTHPQELSEEERAAWQAHFVDYELGSPIAQLSTRVLQPSSDELQASDVLRTKGKCLKRATLTGLLERWGYVKCADNDGGEFHAHHLSLDGDTWRVSVNHGPIPLGYFDAEEQIEVEALVVYRRLGETLQAQRLGELPPALLNTVLVQAQTLAEAGL